MENASKESYSKSTDSVGVTETHEEKNQKLNVVEDKIYGDSEKKNVYVILWERMANNGLVYCYADSEEEAYNLYSYKLNKSVRHTIFKIDRKCMPVTDGRRAN